MTDPFPTDTPAGAKPIVFLKGLKQVLFGLSTSQIKQRMRKGILPEPRYLADGTSYWLPDELNEYLSRQNFPRPSHEQQKAAGAKSVEVRAAKKRSQRRAGATPFRHDPSLPRGAK
jgi:predicted DNA-binding transcriptional regulator AlpA